MTSQPATPQTAAPRTAQTPAGPTTHKASITALLNAHRGAADTCEGAWIAIVPGEAAPRIITAADEHAAASQLRSATLSAHRDAWRAAEGWAIPAGWVMLQLT